MSESNMDEKAHLADPAWQRRFRLQTALARSTTGNEDTCEGVSNWRTDDAWIEYLQSAVTYMESLEGPQRERFSFRKVGYKFGIVEPPQHRSLLKCTEPLFYVYSNYENFKFNPYVDLLWEQTQRHTVLMGESYPRLDTEIEAFELAEELQKIVEKLRMNCRSEEFREILSNFLASPRRINFSLKKNFLHLIDKKVKIGVVRFNAYIRNASAELSGSGQGEVSSAVDRLRSLREKFIRSVNREFRSAAVLQYIWSMERHKYGPPEIHFIFLTTDASEMNVASITRELGEIWRSVGGSTAAFYDCAHMKNTFKGNGIRVYGEDETEEFYRQTRLISDYLTLPNELAQIKYSRGQRAFGRSRTRSSTMAQC